ncbi:MAG: glycosyltransferase family 2 protein [Acidobacteriota bacterium]
MRTAKSPNFGRSLSPKAGRENHNVLRTGAQAAEAAPESQQPVFPRQKVDRRRRGRTRPEYLERREAPRYECRFPVNVHVTRGGHKEVHTALARDISDGGLLLELPSSPLTQKLPCPKDASGSDVTSVHVDFEIPDGTMPEEYLHGRQKLKGRVTYCDAKTGSVAVAFEENLTRKLARSAWFYLRVFSIICIFVTVSLILLSRLQNYYYFWLDVPVFLYSLTVGAYLLTRFLFASLYQTPPPREDLPHLSVIVPAYNEELYIERTLTSILEAEYPADRLEVIVVNDYSSDGTLGNMLCVADKYPELTVLDLRQRSGKRVALASGVKISTGEVVIFVDSDSFLRHDALRNIVDGLADPEVGAVCGHCEVENKWTNVLTKMQAVRYFISFRVIKAAESLFGMNSCLSGPFAAYRRSVLLEVLDSWVHQKYLGRPATYGDDRSLTNMVLRNQRVLYDSRAVTATIVPETYGQFLRQQARWKRSWFRESLKACTFIWRKPPLGALSFFVGFILPVLAPAVVLRAVVYLPLLHDVSPMNYIMGVVLMAALMSSTYLLIQRSRLWLYGVPFCLFYMFVLVWQLPWTILTFFRSQWGTRG